MRKDHEKKSPGVEPVLLGPSGPSKNVNNDHMIELLIETSTSRINF